MATWAEIPRSPGHAFYDRLQELLREADFDAFVEEVCKPYYAPRMGAPSLPPGRYFRMHMIGYFEGIDSERGLAWRCAAPILCATSCGCRTATRFPIILAVTHALASAARTHEKVFGWVLKLVAERGLLKGERIGVDGSTMEANAALRTIVRRDNGESYRAMLTRMAQESGVETPTAEDLAASTESARARRCQRRLGEPDRSRRQDRQDEGRDDASGLQTGTRGRSRHGLSWPRRSIRPTKAIRRRFRRRSKRPRAISTQSVWRRAKGALRRGHRQGLPLARATEGARGWRVEGAHRRTRTS